MGTHVSRQVREGVNAEGNVTSEALCLSVCVGCRDTSPEDLCQGSSDWAQL